MDGKSMTVRLIDPPPLHEFHCPSSPSSRSGLHSWAAGAVDREMLVTVRQPASKPHAGPAWRCMGIYLPSLSSPFWNARTVRLPLKLVAVIARPGLVPLVGSVRELQPIRRKADYRLGAPADKGV